MGDTLANAKTTKTGYNLVLSLANMQDNGKLVMTSEAKLFNKEVVHTVLAQSLFEEIKANLPHGKKAWIGVMGLELILKQH
jgi:hypothetical protein